MKTLSEKIIEQLQSKHDAFLGTEGELSRQRFKDGLMWAIDTIETLTSIDNCEKEYEAEQLRIANVEHSTVFMNPKDWNIFQWLYAYVLFTILLTGFINLLIWVFS